MTVSRAVFTPVFRPVTAALFSLFGTFSPKTLFAKNEQGVWYDPSDLTTLFQDDAGTTPVTAVEQPVGLMLDKSNGLVLGPELVTNGDFSNGSTGWTISEAGVTLVTSSNELQITSSASLGAWQNPTGLVAGKWYLATSLIRVGSAASVSIRIVAAGSNLGTTIAESAIVTGSAFVPVSVAFKATSENNAIYLRVGTTNSSAFFDNISVRELQGNHAYQTTSANRPTLSARYNQFVGTETLDTQNVPTVATTYTLRFEGTGSITLSGTKTGTYSAGTHSLTGVTAGTLTATVTGTVSKADLRVANDGVGIPAYQRVNTATDYDTVGFPLYLRFNGSSSSMVTNTITPGTDKAQVFAGVRKLSDAATGVVAEISANATTNIGVFSLFNSSTSTVNGFGFFSRGTSISAAPVTTGYSPPVTSVLAGIGNIAGNSAILRVNGTQAASNTTDPGTGNYGNYPLYIGARGGTSLWLNGRLYSMIVRFGSNLTTAQITNTENYVNTKTKAY